MSYSALPEYPYQPLFFNQKQFRHDLNEKSRITVFKDAMAGVGEHFQRRFDEGDDIRSLVSERATFIDLILHYAWHFYEWDDDVCLIAVGGYGRKELHPHSDIDILILLSNNAGKKYDEKLEKLVTFLWDIGLEIGSSVRTLKQCIDIAKSDITVATNLMEARRIAGNDHLRDELQVKTDSSHLWPIKSFFKAKLEEQVERHEKHNNTEYDLEPNVKNAPGGLRDIQTINWVAKRFYGVQTLTELEGKDFFTEHEFGILRNGEAFLWKVRYGIHLLSGRAEERLLFEYQRELAEMFGYKDSDRGLAVESFMHEYYRTASALSELNDVLLQYLKEVIHKKKREKVLTINARFQLRDQFIEVTDNNVFDNYPSALLEIFVIMGHTPEIIGARASTIRLIRERRWLIDEDFRKTPTNNAMFLALFSLDYGLVTQLSRMKRYGLLGRYLPEFGRIIGQMQHDLFHRYTVDAHTILVIENMRRFHLPEEEKKFPIAAHIMKRLPKRELLFIAGLFHDIGKGRGGDHSTLGAVDAEKFCVQHGLSRRDTRLVTWLVEKHLLMSYISQKKDISDPEVIHSFALEVGDQTRLNYLYALTVADMCGTNPEIWNSWRASLLRQLYLDTKRALRRGLENTIDKNDLIEEKQVLAKLKLEDKNVVIADAERIWNDMGEEYFIRESHLDIAWQTEAIVQHRGDSPLVICRESSGVILEGATQIFIYAKFQAQVFAVIASCLAHQRLSVQDAHIYHSTSAYTLYTFYVLDENDKVIPEDSARAKKLTKVLLDELSDISGHLEYIKQRTPRQLKQFSIPTQATISNDVVSGYTVLEVISPDRPGLLATLAQIFIDFDIQLHNAKISTLGERIEDVFFIENSNGNQLSDPEFCRNFQQEVCARLDRHVEKNFDT